MTQEIYAWIFKEMFSSGYCNRKPSKRLFLKRKGWFLFLKDFKCFFQLEIVMFLDNPSIDKDYSYATIFFSEPL